MRYVLIVLLLLFVAGCVGPQRKLPEVKPTKTAMIESTVKEAKGTAWALSESNKLFAMFMIFAVIGGVIGGVTRMKLGWVICFACAPMLQLS